jgi:hypothetical protein
MVVKLVLYLSAHDIFDIEPPGARDTNPDFRHSGCGGSEGREGLFMVIPVAGDKFRFWRHAGILDQSAVVVQEGELQEDKTSLETFCFNAA